MAYELKHNLDPKCPYCGYEDNDAWEWRTDEAGIDGSGITKCGMCSKDFKWFRHVSITYSTEAINTPTQKGGESEDKEVKET